MNNGHVLYEYQRTANGLLESTDRNLLIIAPTGAGKTEVGYEALRKYGKGIYTAPTRALCYEKWQELTAEFQGKRVVIGNKDYSLGKELFRRSDFRVMTPWKLNQLIQNSWFCDQSPVVVFDEIHGLTADFEIIITKLKEMYPSVRLIGLSATVDESDEAKFASWLNAVVVKSDERPVPLMERIVHFDVDLDDEGNETTLVKVFENGNMITDTQFPFLTDERRNAHISAIRGFIRDEAMDKSPVLWFSPYRGRAAEIAGWHANSFRESGQPENEELKMLAEQLPAEGSEYSRELITCLPTAVGFHHGGLSQQERELVFEQAQGGKLRDIATCFTLAQGVNLPARHIVFDTIYDYDNASDEPGGKRLMDISIFRQLEGRAGRPQYDNIGFVWIPVFSEVEKVEVEEVLLKYKASKLESRIFNPYFLTATIPQLVQFGFDSPEKIAGFIKATFWGKASQDTFPLMDQLQTIVGRLLDAAVVEANDGKLSLTKVGCQVARLAIHPDEFEVIDRLTRAQELDYETWVSELVRTTADYVIGQNRPEEVQFCLEELKVYGLAIYSAKAKHYSRDMADYLSRLLDITRSYFRLNRRMDDYEERWEKAVAGRFMFGQLHLAEQLSAVLRRDQLKRLIRNLGGALVNYHITDEPTQRCIARLLWGQASFSPNGTATKVAEIIGAEPERFHALVMEEQTKTRAKNHHEVTL